MHSEHCCYQVVKVLENHGCISRLCFGFMLYSIGLMVLQIEIRKEEFSSWTSILTIGWMHSIFEDSWGWKKSNAFGWSYTKIWRHHRLRFWTHEVSKCIIFVVRSYMTHHDYVRRSRSVEVFYHAVHVSFILIKSKWNSSRKWDESLF